MTETPKRPAFEPQTGMRGTMIVFAGAIQRAIRTCDVAGRYGGDEFVLFLPEATPEVLDIIAQRDQEPHRRNAADTIAEVP